MSAGISMGDISDLFSGNSVSCLVGCGLKCLVYGWILSWIQLGIAVIIGFYVFYRIIRFVFADADWTVTKLRDLPKELENKVVWITGASSGIGEALAIECSKRKSKLVLSARREDELQRVKQRCIKEGKTKDEDIFVLPMNLTEFSSHQKLVDRVMEKFGRIEYLINNAGRSQRVLVENMEVTELMDLFNLNTFGTISITKAVLPHMINAKFGRIGVVSSIAGKVPSPLQSAYSSSKYALHGYFDTLNLELNSKNIKVTMICPGFVQTNIVQNSVTGDIKPVEKREAKMTAERCAYLSMKAIVNNVEEAWISYQPVLFFAYLFQYMPSVARWLGKRVAKSRVEAFKSGKDINSGLLSSVVKSKSE